jgi:serpin B
MRNLSINILCIAALLCGSSCSQTTEPNVQPFILPRALTTAEIQLIEADNQFGFEIFKQLCSTDPDSELFISPVSISMALGMAYNGAATSTLSAMHQTLQFRSLTETEINQSYQSLIQLLRNLDPLVEFSIANSIWYRLDFTVLEAFLNTTRTFFYAEIRGMDFNRPDAADIINAWVSNQTRDKIKKIVDKPIDRNIVMFLINAMYFKGTWTYEFDPQMTYISSFQSTPEASLPCRMMKTQSRFNYFEDGNLQMVELPYSDGNFVMDILLPKSTSSVNALISSLNPDYWDNLLAQLETDSVHVELPKFKLEYYEKLNDALAALGMGIAFTDAADFSRITPGGGIFISEVRHKTYIDVNEEGTEAAAVTAIIFERSLISDPIIYMRIDHPFVFMIRERVSGSILFIGKIIYPKYQSSE